MDETESPNYNKTESSVQQSINLTPETNRQGAEEDRTEINRYCLNNQNASDLLTKNV